MTLRLSESDLKFSQRFIMLRRVSEADLSISRPWISILLALKKKFPALWLFLVAFSLSINVTWCLFVPSIYFFSTSIALTNLLKFISASIKRSGHRFYEFVVERRLIGRFPLYLYAECIRNFPLAWSTREKERLRVEMENCLCEYFILDMISRVH